MPRLPIYQTVPRAIHHPFNYLLRVVEKNVVLLTYTPCACSNLCPSALSLSPHHRLPLCEQDQSKCRETATNKSEERVIRESTESLRSTGCQTSLPVHENNYLKSWEVSSELCEYFRSGSPKAVDRLVIVAHLQLYVISRPLTLYLPSQHLTLLSLAAYEF